MTVITYIGTIANWVPSMVPTHATVTVSLHVDDETFDAIVAQHDGRVATLGGTEDCPHSFRTTEFRLNGVRFDVYTSRDQRSHVDVSVES